MPTIPTVSQYSLSRKATFPLSILSRKAQPLSRSAPILSRKAPLLSRKAIPGTGLLEKSLLSILQQDPPSMRRSTAASMLTREAAEVHFRQIIGQLWGTATTKARSGLWLRYTHWCNSQRLPVNSDQSASLFVAATAISPQGMLAYTKALAAIFLRFGWSRSTLLTLAAALRAAGGDIPIKQAEPFTQEAFIQWALKQPERIRVALLICWKTASRWSEARQLSLSNFLRILPHEIVIDWHTLPKNRKRAPWAESRYTVITGPYTTTIARLLKKYLGTGPLCELTTARLNALIKQTFPNLSTRSIKRGAVTWLTQVVDEQGLDPQLIPLVAKHQRPSPVLPPMSMRYAANPLALAHILKSARATQHL